jgi:hypothetical protein
MQLEMLFLSHDFLAFRISYNKIHYGVLAMLHAIPILLILLFVLILLHYHKKVRVIEKIHQMDSEQKTTLLDTLAAPYGFHYDAKKDVFCSRLSAWQRHLGYRQLYEFAALSSNMVLDAEPIYFNYQRQTWLIVLWKGQYGITTGAEVGIYHADQIIPPALRSQTVFQAITDDELCPVTITLSDVNNPRFTIQNTGWWINGFQAGTCTSPNDLTLNVSITFSNEELMEAFVAAVRTIGYRNHEVQIEDTTVSLLFSTPKSEPLLPRDTLYERYILWKTRVLCDLYRSHTTPFQTTVDRMLRLYFCYPWIFRKILSLRQRPEDRW